jgi:hypothetical protein
VLSTKIITSETLGAQMPLLIVQRKIFTPALKPDTSLEELELFEKTADPETKDHKPFPELGVFACRVVEVEHMFCSAPAFEGVGSVETFIITVSLAGGQPAEVTVQMKEVMPAESAESADDASVGVAIFPEPLKIVQSPVPEESEAASVVELEQMLWSGPAEIVGAEAWVMVTVSLTSGQPAEVTVQMKELMPAESAESAESGSVGVAILPEPLKIVQSPVPEESEAASVVELEQMFWSGPAEIVGAEV